ncbi:MULTISPECIES: phosphotransferase [unclassified Streptomyces]|uniref:phosphotransferase n=1 Tax=unclassified Streptomyces TaxID=2593676 RepID=UPI00332CCB13
MTTPGELLGSGRTADVYVLKAGWVLRRDREGRGDAAAEAAVMTYVRRHGYPAPRVRPTGSRTELVLERLSGPTLLAALVAGRVGPAAAGALLAGLLRRLHALPGRETVAEALRRRAANPTMSAEETESLGEVGELVRKVTQLA